MRDGLKYGLVATSILAGVTAFGGYQWWQEAKKDNVISRYALERDCDAFMTTLEGTRVFNQAVKEAPQDQSNVSFELSDGRTCAYDRNTLIFVN